MDLLEWAQLAVRWFHVVAGITWIGQTYLFNWMDRHMHLPEGSKGVTGEVWMVHGGGFFHLEKVMVPERIPERLLWFKWEAMLTWLSGLVLLTLHFYTIEAMLIGPEPRVGYAAGVAIGVGALAGAVVVYNLLWMSPLGRFELAGAAVSLPLVMAAAWGLQHLLTARAAYIHVGAMFGTIMVTNVWMRILPSQRQMIAARNSGTEPDLARAERARRSSKHNTYMSIPLIFLMISYHFPGATYGNSYAWAILGGLTLVGWMAARILRGPSL